MSLKETIIVGNSTQALLTSLSDPSARILLFGQNHPRKYDKLGDLSEVKVWSDLYWMNFFANKILCDAPKSVAVEDSKLRLTHHNSTRSEWHFDYLFLETLQDVDIDPAKIEVLHDKKTLKVVDYFEVRAGMSHDKEEIETDDDFVKKAIFYVTDRIDGNTTKKDVVTVSYLSPEQVQDFSYSDTMVKFKLEKLMKTEIQQIKKANLQHTHREIIPMERFKILEPRKGKAKVMRLKSKLSTRKLYERYKQEYTG